MTDELKSRPSGVPGLVVRDVVPPASKGAKYALVHETSGGMLSLAHGFRTVKAARACATELANLGDWERPPRELQPLALATAWTIERHWREQRQESKPSKTMEAVLGEPVGTELPAAVFAASDSGRCVCGLATLDPLHAGWHRIHQWNAGIFAKARARRAEEFDEKLADHNRRHQRRVIVPPATIGR